MPNTANRFIGVNVSASGKIAFRSPWKSNTYGSLPAAEADAAAYGLPVVPDEVATAAAAAVVAVLAHPDPEQRQKVKEAAQAYLPRGQGAKYTSQLKLLAVGDSEAAASGKASGKGKAAKPAAPPLPKAPERLVQHAAAALASIEALLTLDFLTSVLWRAMGEGGMAAVHAHAGERGHLMLYMFNIVPLGLLLQPVLLLAPHAVGKRKRSGKAAQEAAEEEQEAVEEERQQPRFLAHRAKIFEDWQTYLGQQ